MDPPPKLPDPKTVSELFRRKKEIPSVDTSVTFSFFAQWFTDSFLRTDPHSWQKNTSNHGIDLCQIYGLTQRQTDALRAKKGGRLRGQLIDGEEYPAFLYERRHPKADLTIRPEFKDLYNAATFERVVATASEEHKEWMFAVGLENGNSTIGHTILNIVFLREHNRIAGILADEYKGQEAWDDDRLFETTRNIMIAVFLKLVIEEYIKHIGPNDFPIEAVPFAAEKAAWNRPNWITIEFNLLYRWHSLVPDEIGTGRERLGPRQFINNNPLVVERGVEALLAQCSRDPAGRIGLHNTPAVLMEPLGRDPVGVMPKTIAMMRQARLASFNDYRAHFSLPRLKSYTELTADTELARELENLYGSIDNLEWYVGLFAEDHPPAMMMGRLLGTMVGYDAFTQALTNPLLDRRVYNADSFTPTGLEIIEKTTCLEQIVKRNSKYSDFAYAQFRIAKPGRLARIRRWLRCAA
ncbi:MAG TPA: peroxidase family protein [Aldersonia sp.]